jgi:glycine dehydrogenase subunit 1
VCCSRAHELAGMIGSTGGARVLFDGPFFREFVVETDRPNGEVLAAARAEGVLAGIPLDRYFGEAFANRLLVAVTEKHTSEDLRKFSDVLKSS